MEQRCTVDEAADIARLTQRLQEVHDSWNALAQALEPDA